ncbi:MAG: SH3 domain-containing protein [Gemmataceae bacterium]|nr:SH3 domain-containing protein [Gemmataceae bacterium]
MGIFEVYAMRCGLAALLLSGSIGTVAWGQPPQLPGLPLQPPSANVPGLGNPPSTQTPSLFPQRLTITDPRGVEVRSGPSLQMDPTQRLRPGDTVLVIRESRLQPGWYEIAPPPGSFSWVDGKYVKQVDRYTGVIDVDGNGEAPVLPGSSLVGTEPKVESVKIASGYQVQILEPPMEVNGRKWYRIAPPGNDVRFIPKDAVQPAQVTNVAPPNFSRPTTPGAATLPGFSQTASSGTTWTVPGQTVPNSSPGTSGTPASFTHTTGQWTQYNGIATQPPQWSQWGRLRRTAFEKDGQPMYVLEDRHGQVLLYVTTAPGTSLRSYVDQIVCLYGSISYRSDGYQRTYYMTATHVATP